MEQVSSLALHAPPPGPGPDALDRLLTRAPSPDPHFADAVTRALKDLPAYGEEGITALGKRLVALLDSGQLRGMIGTDGAICETLVAKRVLELGYPWALHLTPRQLEWVRELSPPRRPGPGYPAFVVSAVALTLDLLPLLFIWIEWDSGDPFVMYGGLYRLLAAGAAGVNLLFAGGRLSRARTSAIASVSLAVSWLCFELTGNFDAEAWGLLGSSWAVTLLASRLARPPANGPP